MPKDSKPPDLPSEQELAEEIDEEPLIGNRHADVRHVLQDIVLFAQDFIDVLDDLAEEPIVPLEVFLMRGNRAAGRFMGPGRRHPEFRMPGGRAYAARHGVMERRREGHIRWLRGERVLFRPLHQGRFQQLLRPGQFPINIPREEEPGEGPDNEDEPDSADELSEGPDNVDEPGEGPDSADELSEGPDSTDEPSEGPDSVDEPSERPVLEGDVSNRPHVVQAEQGRSVVEKENSMPFVTVAEAAGPSTPRVETGCRLIKVSSFSSEQAKRARLDIEEAGCSEQSRAGDKSKGVEQDSSDSN